MIDLTPIAKDIIKNNIYLTLGTADGNPWVAPLFYCVTEDYVFYFISQLTSVHTKHLLKNPNVAFAIFDSHDPEGKGNGVQADGKAYLIGDEELPEALKYYHTTFIPVTAEMLTGENPYRLFKLIPEHFYVLDPEARVDKRVEVKLR
ncbi:MAG: pyridoxamine 5'-phosphate oxidase family protein [bacterium]|nr:pyridoxamine 5'-phosphate oxidase family protein [bacterium]